MVESPISMKRQEKSQALKKWLKSNQQRKENSGQKIFKTKSL
jgi:hypothetical protein